MDYGGAGLALCSRLTFSHCKPLIAITGHRHVCDDGNDDSEEQHAGDDGAEAKTAIFRWLREQVTEGGTQPDG